MRPIKFRGRDIDTGKFVSAELGQVSAEINDKYLTFITDDVHLVDEDSIAQLVGFDSAGNEVYEGDVLTFEHDGKHYEYTAGLQPFARNDDGLVHYKFDSLQLKGEKKP